METADPENVSVSNFRRLQLSEITTIIWKTAKSANLRRFENEI